MSVAQLVPDLLIAGVQKAGTSALAQMLSVHPEVDFAAVKEPGFLHLHENPELRRLIHDDSVMAHERMADPQVYARLFDIAPGQVSSRLRAEASTVYFESERARAAVSAARMAGHQAQIVLSLRDPVRRAHSAWLWMRKAGLEPLDSFEAALEAEETRREQGWWIDYHYYSRGLYLAPLNAWRQAAGPDNCHIVLFEQIIQVSQRCDSLHIALGLDPDLSVGLEPVNPSGLHKSALRRGLAHLADRHSFRERQWKQMLPESVRRALGRVRTVVKDRLDQELLPPPTLDPTLEKQLRARYADEVGALSETLGKDLPTLWWGN